MKKRPGIYKRGEIYWITYMLKGQQCFESSHSRKFHDAEALLFTRRGEINRGALVVSPSKAPDLCDLLKSYIAQIENPNTRQRYLRSEKVLLEYFGNPRITDLNAFAIDGFKDVRRNSHPPERIESLHCCAAL